MKDIAIIIGVGISGIGGIMLLTNSATSQPMDAPIEAASLAPKTEFTVHRGKSSVTLGLGQKITQEKILATTMLVSKPYPIRYIGANVELGTFSPKATQKYAQKYGKSNNCPASFFNKYAQRVTLYASTPDIAAKFKRKHRNKYWEADQWEYVTVSGRCVTKPAKLVKNGVDVTSKARIRMPKSYLECSAIWVEAIDFEPADLTEI